MSEMYRCMFYKFVRVKRWLGEASLEMELPFVPYKGLTIELIPSTMEYDGFSFDVDEVSWRVPDRLLVIHIEGDDFFDLDVSPQDYLDDYLPSWTFREPPEAWPTLDGTARSPLRPDHPVAIWEAKEKLAGRVYQDPLGRPPSS